MADWGGENSGHTPGPWRIHGPTLAGSYYPTGGDTEGLYGIHLYAPGDLSICHLTCVTSSYDRTLADARLIAAAPDLLRLAVLVMGADGGFDIQRQAFLFRACVDAARAAIAKAEGR